MIPRYLLSALILTTLVGGPAVAQDKPALKGLDPVLLTQGKEAKGDPAVSLRRGRFRYQFVNAESKRIFEAAPERFEVQLNGSCCMMPMLAGNPDNYVVVNERIYVGFRPMCTAGFKADPQAALKRFAETKKVAVFVFPGVQVIDYSGPHEVMTQAGFQTFTVAEKSAPVSSATGLTILPEFTIDDCPKVDILILPGGGVNPHATNSTILNWVKDRTKQTEYVMSVCNGAFFLANAGLLDGLTATTFHGMIDQLKSAAPNCKVVSDQRYVDNGKIITTAGLSSGIDGALHLVEKIRGFGAAQSVALGMEYDWRPKSDYARAALADKHLRKMLGQTGFDLDKIVTGWTVVLLDGDRTKWRKEWDFRSKSTPAELMKIVDAKLAESWTRTDSSAGAMQSAWKFKDEEGQGWTAAAELKPPANAEGAFHLVVKLQKS
jgi:putative intracellular protease/amidase